MTFRRARVFSHNLCIKHDEDREKGQPSGRLQDSGFTQNPSYLNRGVRPEITRKS